MTAPVDEARDEYADQMNLELRQSIAARVLEAMDVDQYLIDAVRNAKPPAEELSTEEPTVRWSVVQATLKPGGFLSTYCRAPSPAVSRPWLDGNGNRWEWDALTDVEVLRVGIGPEPLAEWEKELLGAQERRDIEADAYKVGERTGAAILAGQIHHRLQKLLTEAITSERKSAYEKAIQVVEDLKP